MSSIAPLVTIKDYQDALESTLNMLEQVLSSDPDMSSDAYTFADADQWLDACRAALNEARRTP